MFLGTCAYSFICGWCIMCIFQPDCVCSFTELWNEKGCLQENHMGCNLFISAGFI